MDGTLDWLLDKLCNETTNNLIKIATVLWGMWFAINKRIFEEKNMTPTFRMTRISKHIAEWRTVNKKRIHNPAELGVSLQQHNQKRQPQEI